MTLHRSKSITKGTYCPWGRNSPWSFNNDSTIQALIMIFGSAEVTQESCGEDNGQPGIFFQQQQLFAEFFCLQQRAEQPTYNTEIQWVRMSEHSQIVESLMHLLHHGSGVGHPGKVNGWMEWWMEWCRLPAHHRSVPVGDRNSSLTTATTINTTHSTLSRHIQTFKIKQD